MCFAETYSIACKSNECSQILNINYYHTNAIEFYQGQHNAFPRRLPSAGSDKLRQMYLNTDTISGQLVLSSAHEQSRQRRLSLLRKTLIQQEKELAERNKQVMPFNSTQINLPATSEVCGYY